MPQMAPTLWLPLFITLSFILTWMSSIMYFFLVCSTEPSTMTLITQKKHWLW
uniref:ATP synthase F0 subunit 8 n=1 Tax=Onisimus nanseni TaxID=583350 RepID=D3G9K5_ONINA|nr:ATP synthase F0 subunit 8 [Onisimus nanseni]